MAAAHIYVLGRTRNRYHDARLSIRDRVRASWRKISQRDYGCHEQGHPRPSVSIKLRSSNFEREQLFFSSSGFWKLRNRFPKCRPTARGYRYRQISSYPKLPGIVSSTPCRYADWLQHNTGVLQYRIARPIPSKWFGSHTAENTAGIDHRGERTDSRTKSDAKDIRHSSIWKNPGKRKSDPPGNIPHPRNKFTRIASSDTINVTTPDVNRRITVQREEDPVQGIALHRFLSFERKLEHEPGLWNSTRL